MLTRQADNQLTDTSGAADTSLRQSRVRAGWLATDADPLFVVMHEAAAPVRDTAILMCPPFGWEEARSYRAWRAGALGLAEAGFPTARMSFPGSGDSGGAPTDDDRLVAGADAIAAAAGWLRAHTGCQRVAAFGVGLGGMLACAAVGDGAPVDDLILWAVPASGRRQVRELKAYAAMTADSELDPAEEDEDAAPTGALPPLAGRERDLELTGYVLTEATVAALEALDLTALPVPDASARRVLMLERAGRVDPGLRKHLEGAGADVTVTFGGDYDVLMSTPQLAVLPQELVPALSAWLQAGPAGHPREADAPDAPPLSGSIELDEGGATVRESVLDFPITDGRGFAILTEPSSDRAEAAWAVVLNAGALNHAGPSRTAVELARRWGARGTTVVRVDLEGIGEADGDSEQHRTSMGLHDARMLEQTAGVLDELDRRGGPGRYILVGTCSGAYLAMHTGARDPRVCGVLTVNLSSFSWSPQLAAERQGANHRRAIRAAARRRLRERDVSFKQVGTALRELRGGTFRAETAPVERTQFTAAGPVLEGLGARNVETLMLLGESEPLRRPIESLVAEGPPRPWLKVEPLPSRDHLYRALPLQAIVHATLDRGLERVLAAQPRGRSGQEGP